MDTQIDRTGAPRAGHGRRWARGHLVAVVALAGVVLAAVGCGDDDDAVAQEAPEADATEPAAEEAAATTATSAPSTEAGHAAMGSPSDPRVVPANSSPTVMAGADTVHCIATAEHTGGSYSFLEIEIPEGSGPPPHEHPSADEFFYVLSGTVSIDIDDLHAEVGPGDHFHVPRGSTHSLTALTDVRLLAGYVPGGDELVLFGCPT